MLRSRALFRITNDFLRRSMSSSATGTKPHLFVVYVLDMNDAEGFQRRLSVRESHLEGVKPDLKSGLLKIGGAMLTPDSVSSPDAPKKMVGSVLIFEGESLEQVRKRIEADIYYTSGTWDKEKLVIVPFTQAVGIPLQ